MTKPTVHEKIMSIITMEWQPSWRFIKVNTPLGWIGTSGDREARRMAEEGKILRRRVGKYAYYKLKDTLF